MITSIPFAADNWERKAPSLLFGWVSHDNIEPIVWGIPKYGLNVLYFKTQCDDAEMRKICIEMKLRLSQVPNLHHVTQTSVMNKLN